MPRIGKNGKLIGVYKLRTMHPYSEYLHDYVLKENGYGSNGKPANDFRLTTWGKILRRYWLDELPQLLNVLKGEMKLVGIRPVSKRYFQDIPESLQKLRLTDKPGCIPPYVFLDTDSSKDSVLEAEEVYLRMPKRGAYKDTVFAVMAIRNIIIRKKRSA
ncbi:MAG: sugar transferase [Crocinitomicaceae bacterium]|nr:sugar transferase [Flavobacteriales bacterium]NQZ35019.1 sugar transferase [Crocinitomicaceae bacterium]